MKRILFLAGLVLYLLSGCGGGGGHDRSSAAPADLSSTITELRIEPGDLTLAQDTAQKLTAVGILSDGSRKDVTADARWESSSPDAVTVGNGEEAGLVRALQRGGQAVITASIGDKNAQINVQVTYATLEAITIDQKDGLTLPKGVSGQLTATGRLSDGTTQDVTHTLDWSSSDAAVAEVGNEVGNRGEVKAKSPGTVTITATHPFRPLPPATTTVTVKDVTLEELTLSPSQADVPLGTLCTLTATGRYSDGSEADLTGTVAWALSNPGIAAFEGAGKVRAQKEGGIVVTATLGGKNARAEITITEKVLASITVTPADAVIIPGSLRSFDAFGIYSDGSVADLTDDADWSSSDAKVATVSFFWAPGLVKAGDPGTAEITAGYKGVKGTARATVTMETAKKLVIIATEGPFLPSTAYPFKAQVFYSDGAIADVTDQVEWSSSEPAVASVENALGKWGRVMTALAGTTEIVAEWGDLEDRYPMTVE